MATGSSQPLIVGAGPVGLAAAVFLAHAGIRTRIIDAASGRSSLSKALAVNPRTLEILEPSGITEQMLAIGRRITGAQLRRAHHDVIAIDFADLPSRFPFMLALSQATTVRLLEEELNRRDVRVEWNARMTACRNEGNDAVADIKAADGVIETIRCPWLLAADGAHSVARQSLHIEFDGTSLDQPWHLADVPLATPLDESCAHIVFLPGGGFLFLIRVVGDAQTPSPADSSLWRVISDRPQLQEGFEDQVGRATGPAVWTSSFHVAHRIVSHLQIGHVYLAGDAGHVHSPIGARGMNLGIEDAWIFARLCQSGQLDRYSSLRRPVDRRVVRRIAALSRVVGGHSAVTRAIRVTALPLAMSAPFARPRLLATLSGLDHPLSVD